MAYCTVPPTMQYSVNVDPSQMMHQQAQLSSPLWATSPNDVPQPAQSPGGPMLLLMPPLPVQQMGQAMSPMSPISPSAMSAMSPMSPNPLSPTALSPMSPVEFYPGSPSAMRNYHRSNSGATASDGPCSPLNTSNRSSKGPISKLQEFVQSSKAHPLPSSCAVLQWSHENRMAGSSLQFRATTSFLLDGVPHHVLGGWWPSKKQSQRDAAERALAFFIGVCGNELTKGHEGHAAGRKSPLAEGQREDEPDEVYELEDFVGEQLRWSCRWEAQDTQDPILEALCKATVEFQYLGVSHVFAGKACSSKVAAKTDTARRVLWYLHCPGYENAFEVEQDQVKTLAQAIPEPVPGTWPPTQEALNAACSPSTVASTCEQEMDLSPCSPSPLSPGQRSQAEQAELLERKTTVMRLQNRLQKIFAKQLTPGKSVWCWRYEKNEVDHTFQASVHISLLDRTFTGGWASTHQAAQMEACNRLTTFLDKDFKM